MISTCSIQHNTEQALKSSPELQVAIYSVANGEIITDTQNVDAMRKLSLTSHKP